MSEVVGVELSANALRAVSLDAWRAAPRATAEVPWDPEHPSDAVTRLREQLGETSRVALSVGLAFLHIKHVKLPPAPVEERRRIISFEPDRFFPVQDESLVVSLVGEENLAFAVDAALLERWIAAFELWAPVESVEPAPSSLARVLGTSVRHDTFELPAGEGERGLVELVEGHVHAARRVRGELGELEARSLPTLGRLPAHFLLALGAARGVYQPTAEMLMSERHAGQLRARRVRRVVSAAVVCAAALGFALWSLDRSRERTLSEISAELSALAPTAAPALGLRDRLAVLEREAQALQEITRQRPDPLRVLAALSARLPAGVTVLSVRVSGEEWQLDGTARDAAALVPLLDRDERFEGVRFLSASARFREGNRTYETFSIALRVRPGA